SVPSPGTSDFVILATATFSGRTTNFTLNILSNYQWIRARVTTASVGGIAVFGDSASGTLNGAQNGSGTKTVVVDSQLDVAGVGTGFTINSPVIPSITTDDVYYAGNFNFTLTEYLDGLGGATGFQPKIGTGAITANEADV